MELSASQFLRAVRGSRSQVAFARRLGYRANPITDWENGRRYPTVAEALRAATRAGVDVAAAFARFHPAAPPDPEAASIAGWLDAVRGSLAIGELAERTGRSRFAVGRWLRGQAEPRVPDFFRLVDAITGRLPDLVAELVPIEQVPELLPRHRTAHAAKRLAFDEPWTEAVLRVLETEAYAAHCADGSAWIAGRLGIASEDVARALDKLEQAAVVRRDGDRYLVAGNLTVDTVSDPVATRDHMAHWARIAFDHFGRPEAKSLFAYNVVSLSHEDLTRVRELLRGSYREVRAIVAASEPTETAALLNVQLVEFV